MNRAKKRREKHRENARHLTRWAEFCALPIKLIPIPIGNVGMSHRAQTFHEWEAEQLWGTAALMLSAHLKSAAGK